ncbi:N-acetylmuramoyl-L-alanine amidase [Corynebacterium comes]|uniref:N-acetylmuramoyl-L-alanine amidase n=1 Tax=Corynebacterium comes TaxID=2675218 RepID=A0A6B8W150_9CORY|nr:N-acetylmuramoyl-L-alanine amidase [Corynebacterium comes]QGU05727.1 N-acetylmuramoyl-L-alanine amidase [Corynebacterium comes]
MQQRRRIATPRQASVSPTLAVVLSLALAVSAAFGGNQILKTQDTGGNPIDVTSAEASFADGANVVVEDAAIAAQSGVPGPRTVKEFSREDQFSMFAVTWNGYRDIAAYVRSEQPDGSWGPWWAAEPIGQTGPGGENGTELLFVEPTNRVQVSITGVDFVGEPAEEAAPAAAPEVADVDINVAEAPAPEPAPAPAPAPEPAPAPAGLAPLPSNYGDIQPVADVADATDLGVVFIDGRAEEGGIALATDSVTYGMPKVVTRAGWGANESNRCRNATYDDGLQAAGVHHTAGSNNYTRAQSASIVRGIYDYHARTLGWCDVGYNALVDKYGTIYEGRYGGLDKNVQGAHIGGFNHNTFGISMMGNYDVAPTTPEMVNSVGEMIGWKAAISGFDPKGSARYTPLSFNGSKYQGGVSMTLPNIFAHRDAHNNACPGTFGYAQMGTIRSVASQKYQAIRSGSTGTTTTTAPSTTTTTTTTAPPTDVDTQPEPSTTPIQPSEPAPQNDTIALLSSAANGEQTALLTIIGSLAALAVTYFTTNGSLPGTTTQVGDVQVLEGITLADLKPVLDVASSLAGDTKTTQAVNRVNTTYGAVLGEPRGGVNTQDATYALFDNGIVLDETGSDEARALWGSIGDLWAGQGFDLGPLGMPLNEQYNEGDLVRVDFEGGYVTVDPATGDVNVKLN